MKDGEGEFNPDVRSGVQNGGNDVGADDDVDWLECISAIETPQGVLYFCDSAYFTQAKFSPDEYSLSTEQPGNSVATKSTNSSRRHQQRKDRRISRSIPSFVSRFPNGVCLYSITAYNPLNLQQHPVDNHFNNQYLLDDLKAAFPDSEILKNFSYFPNKPHHFERGFTIMVPIRHPHNQEKTIYRLAMKYRQAAYFMCEIEETGKHRQKLVLLLGPKPEVAEESLVVLERLSYHPAYLHPKNNSVFHSFEVAMDILSRCAKFPETQELFKIATDQVNPGLLRKHHQSGEPRHPIIAVEGISDAGISKQSQSLSQSLGAQCVQSPPGCIQHLRPKFDQQNDLVRAAFYYIGNYIVSSQMDELAKRTPVIVDRYWNSTTAFTIVSEVGNGSSNLPPKDHCVYDWPSDLRKPDAVVLLGSRREIRRAGNDKLRCRKELQKRQMIVETLRRMKSPKWIEVDRCKDQCWAGDDLTVVTIDKLRALKLVSLGQSSEDGLCPAATLHPHVEHDVLPLKEHVLPAKENDVPPLDLGTWKDDIPFL